MDTTKQADMKKKIKCMPLENKKTKSKQIISPKSLQKDKRLDYSSCKILGTILIAVDRRTSTNGSENKKTYEDA